MTTIDNVVSIKGLLFKITDYLDIFDLFRFRKSNKELYNNLIKNSEYIFKNLVKYYNIQVFENKTSINFRRENYAVSIQKSNIINYFEKCFYLSKLYNTPANYFNN